MPEKIFKNGMTSKDFCCKIKYSALKKWILHSHITAKLSYKSCQDIFLWIRMMKHTFIFLYRSPKPVRWFLLPKDSQHCKMLPLKCLTLLHLEKAQHLEPKLALHQVHRYQTDKGVCHWINSLSPSSGCRYSRWISAHLQARCKNIWGIKCKKGIFSYKVLKYYLTCM